jgi:hypothetical protein
MSTALPISAPQTETSRRIPVLAAASALLAATSIAVTLAVTGAGGDVASPPTVPPAKATPDLATQYQRGAENPTPSGPIDGQSAAERFHHFR